jgi:hypothetical protein
MAEPKWELQTYAGKTFIGLINNSIETYGIPKGNNLKVWDSPSTFEGEIWAGCDPVTGKDLGYKSVAVNLPGGLHHNDFNTYSFYDWSREPEFKHPLTATVWKISLNKETDVTPDGIKYRKNLGYPWIRSVLKNVSLVEAYLLMKNSIDEKEYQLIEDTISRRESDFVNVKWK